MKHIAITLSLLAIAMIPLRGGDWYDGGLWQAMYMHSWSAGHDLPKNAWIYLYKVIALCNKSLATLDSHKTLAGTDYESLYEGPGAIDESDGHTKVFPIPAEVRALNKNLTQNPGY